MAVELDDGEFWLPSEFLTDDDLLKVFKIHPYGSSPVDSLMGSESDEDDYVTSRKIANTTFPETNFTLPEYLPKGLKLSGSPQSTLCGCKSGSTRTSPNCTSPTIPREAAGLDLLYAAAGEIARLRLIEENMAFYSANRLAELRAAANAPSKNPTGFDPVQTRNHLSYQQFQQMKQQQAIMSNGAWKQGKIGYQLQNGKRNGPGQVSGLPASAWPTPQQSQVMQQRTGSGMRAVFLGETGPKKERTGTGVFLPRRYGASNPVDTRMKQGCSVLLPDKVVHALNLNLESVDSQPQIRGNGRGYFTPEYDAGFRHGNHLSMDQQKRNLRPMVNQEIRLPQEWTY